ncbi:MAG: hypothetical protein KF850_17510 [Labilithrix sp.]|nr:hypothetical protein [Labilithrix sp.]
MNATLAPRWRSVASPRAPAGVASRCGVAAVASPRAPAGVASRCGVAALVGLGALLFVTPASADVQSCLSASENGQRARAAGKLREAREQFVVCGGDGCPAIVRRDCAQWNSELAQTLPTVVFGARDREGRDLFDVTVTMDGEPLVTKLDGKSITVDPGKHTFRFEADGFEPASETALIKEGERARAIDVTLGGDRAAPPDGANGGGGHTPYPWIVVGLGAAGVTAGVVIALTSPERPANCNADTQTCTRLPGQSAADFLKDQETAGTADSQPVLGWVVAGAGAALVAGGLLWHFLEPTGDEKSSSRVRFSPWTTGQSSGAALGGRF